jgi:hypothetical protein
MVSYLRPLSSHIFQMFSPLAIILIISEKLRSKYCRHWFFIFVLLSGFQESTFYQ